ncbi:hypothetical protein HDU87_007454 [Geranomyces variabilis]|uniref:Uncharacterized protein n=1 Tax=Geranomyces variabilis TaxID=109894 RepID=A0AAD5TPG8_9FUNG|nr:hypothetical protein HDU87_007454 [Geranomyces variabilis]
MSSYLQCTRAASHAGPPTAISTTNDSDTIPLGNKTSPPQQQRAPILTETLNGRKRNYFRSTADGNLLASGRESSKLTWEWSKDTTTMTALDRLGRVLPPGVVGWLRAMFLPVGYPQVNAEVVDKQEKGRQATAFSCGRCAILVYAKVHIYQFLETFIWSAVSVLCSQAMLSSIGVGSTAAAGGAVAIQWILKDGIGEIGKLFFIQRFARSFDSHPKTWKMIGEVSSLSGAFLQLCTVVAPSHWFLGLASVGYALRSIHFSIWGATHMTFTRNFALQGNVGDLVAKDDSQMSVAHLGGMLGGVGILTLSHTPVFLFGVFFLLIPVHFHMTLSLLRAANFEVLNQTTLTVICKRFVKTGVVPTMPELKPYVKGFGEWIENRNQFPRIEIAAEASKLEDVEEVLALLKDERYLLSIPSTRTSIIRIPLHASAAPHDVIKAALHATKFHELMFDTANSSTDETMPLSRALALMKESHEWTAARFPHFIADVDYKDWQSDAVFWGDSGRRVDWEKSDKDKEA